MKRSEMIDHIESELLEFVKNYNVSEGHTKRQEHISLNSAAGILDMIEGFGMLPPMYIDYIDKENGNTLCRELFEWENEGIECPKNYGSYDQSTRDCLVCKKAKLYVRCNNEEHTACAGWGDDHGPNCCTCYKVKHETK